MLSRMRSGVNIFELLDANLRINLRGVEFGMAKHRLDVTDVCAIFQHQGGHGVAEQVTGAGFADIGIIDVLGHLSG